MGDLPFGEGGQTDDQKIDKLFDPLEPVFNDSDRRTRKIMLKIIFDLINKVRVLEGKNTITQAQFKTRLKLEMNSP